MVKEKGKQYVNYTKHMFVLKICKLIEGCFILFSWLKTCFVIG